MIRFLALALTALLTLPLAAQETTPEAPQLPLVVGVWTCDGDILRWRWVDDSLTGVMWLILVDKRIVHEDPCLQPVGETYPGLSDFFTIIPSKAQIIAIRDYLNREGGGQ